MIRRAFAVASCALLLGAVGVTACSDDRGAGGGKRSPTTRSEDPPDTGPQSGPNPAGGEPVPGSAPPG